jgi:hypothetical protein
MTEVRPLFADQQPPGPAAEDIGPSFVEMARAIASIVATRILAMVAVIGAVAMFGYAVIAPEPWRLYAADCYAAFVLFPIVMLHLRKG